MEPVGVPVGEGGGDVGFGGVDAGAGEELVTVIVRLVAQASFLFGGQLDLYLENA